MTWENGHSRRQLKEGLLTLGAVSAVAVLIVLGAIGWLRGEVPTNLSFGQPAPPWIPFLQRIFEPSPVEFTSCRDLLAENCGPVLHGTDQFVRGNPSLTGVAGRRYSYFPRPTDRVKGFRLGDGPPWLSLDPETGSTTGTPPSQGRFDITLFVQTMDGYELRLRWPVFVSERPHPLGTGQGGRDVLLLLASGAKWILPYGLLVCLISVGSGLVLGGLAGYYGGWIAFFAGTLVKTLESIPGLLLLAIVAILTNYEMHWAMIALGVVLVPETLRAVEAQVTQFKKRDFVEAARELGETDFRILWVEILWRNLRPLVLIQATRAFGYSILMEITLRYLGLGSQGWSWGRLLQEWKSDPQQSPWLGVSSVVMIIGSIGAFLLLEKAIRMRIGRRSQ